MLERDCLLAAWPKGELWLGAAGGGGAGVGWETASAFRLSLKLVAGNCLASAPPKEKVLRHARGLLRRRETAQLTAPHEMGAKCVKSHSLLAFMTHLAANPRKVLF